MGEVGLMVGWGLGGSAGGEGWGLGGVRGGACVIFMCNECLVLFMYELPAVCALGTYIHSSI